jgi:hypothetical protein
MAQQQDGSPSFQSVAEFGAAAVKAGIAFWWRWPTLLTGGVPAHDPAEMDRQERDKAATARVVAAQIEAMRTLADSINAKAPAGAPAQAKPARRTAKKKSKRRHKG